MYIRSGVVLRNISGIFLVAVFGAVFGSPLYLELSVFSCLQPWDTALLCFAFFSRFLNISLLYASPTGCRRQSGAHSKCDTGFGMIFMALILHESVASSDPRRNFYRFRFTDGKCLLTIPDSCRRKCHVSVFGEQQST